MSDSQHFSYQPSRGILRGQIAKGEASEEGEKRGVEMVIVGYPGRPVGGDNGFGWR